MWFGLKPGLGSLGSARALMLLGKGIMKSEDTDVRLPSRSLYPSLCCSAPREAVPGA